MLRGRSPRSGRSNWVACSKDKSTKWDSTKYHALRRYDYAPATLDPILTDRGVKEPEERKIATATLVRFERDARTLALISSFADMAGVSAAKVIKEALEEKDLSQRVKDALSSLADMEVSRGHATYHSLALSSGGRLC